MRHVVFCFVLFLASLGFAQQQPPSTSPPYQTPPTLPGGSLTPREQMPPDMQAPRPKTTSAEQVEQQIMQHLSSEPTLAHTTAAAKVDEDSVVLTGSVDTETEHDVAVRIARSYADHRRIVDEIKIRQQK
jgi:FtsZ-interacting cell division protein YlmF